MLPSVSGNCLSATRSIIKAGPRSVCLWHRGIFYLNWRDIRAACFMYRRVTTRTAYSDISAALLISLKRGEWRSFVTISVRCSFCTPVPFNTPSLFVLPFFRLCHSPLPLSFPTSVSPARQPRRRDRGGNYVITSAVLITLPFRNLFHGTLCCCTALPSTSTGCSVAPTEQVSIGCNRKFSDHPDEENRAAANYNFPRVLVTPRREGGGRGGTRGDCNRCR